MQHERAHGVGVLVEEKIQVGLGESFGGSQNSVGIAHPGKRGYKRTHLRRESRPGSKNIKIRSIRLRGRRKPE
jgi:hypothetical protein